MHRQINVVLFSEINSKLGSPFLRILSGHPMVKLSAVVSSPEGSHCSYFAHDETSVDLEKEAKALGISILRPRSVNDANTVSFLKDASPDYIIVGNFQQKIKSEILSIPRKSVLNFHPSPLPRYAGLAPFYWLIRNGERESAISVIRMDEGLDTGPLVMQRPVHISNTDTALSLRTRQEQQNVLMLLELIPKLQHDDFEYTPQDLRLRSYFGRPNADDFSISPLWDAETVHNYVRAAYRHPGAILRLPGRAPSTVLSVARTHTRELGTPLSPGRIIQIDGNVYLAVSDEWLRVLTVEMNGQEVKANPDTIEIDTNHIRELPGNITIPQTRTCGLDLHP